jgi:hypothetical protein
VLVVIARALRTTRADSEVAGPIALRARPAGR